MKNIFYIAIVLFTATLLGCGGNENGENGWNSSDLTGDGNVNAIEQALPQIMVLPSDNTLKAYGALTESSSNGRTYYKRDYSRYLKNDGKARRLFSSVQSAFINANYPINDFEQTLKQLDTQETTDMVDGIGNDAKTRLLTIAQPDIILELDYFADSGNKISFTSHNYGNKGKSNAYYTLNAIDAYTNKVVASINASNLSGKSITELIQKDMENKLPGFQMSIQKYFKCILHQGRDITVRISVKDDCPIRLSDESVEGDTYSDYLVDYMKSHTVNGAFKLQRNTDKEIYFVNCRIKILSDDGSQYGVYDWARDLQRTLRKKLGLRCSNLAQGLGQVLITIDGI